MKIMIIDGNSIINRAFYGIRMLTSPDGTPTNAVFGFLTILKKLLTDEKPDSVAVCFDLKGPTFRHERFAGYKAQRAKMPEELAIQLPIIKEVLDTMGILRLQKAGLEADDIIGTLTRRFRENDLDSVVVTGDRDSFQLINDRVSVKFIKTHMGKTETKNYSPAGFIEEYGFEPVNIIDLKALMGDSSDNIPGVRGIGEKTAMELVRKYKTIDEIYRNINELDIKFSMRQKLIDGEANARLSYELATIITDAEVDITIDELTESAGLFRESFSFEKAQSNSGAELAELFKRLGFNSLIEKWGLEKNVDGRGGKNIFAETELTEKYDDIDSAITLVQSAVLIALLPSADFLHAGISELSISDGAANLTIRESDAPDKFEDLLKILFSPDTKKISHNVKDIMRKLLERGYSPEGFIFDTVLAAYLLEPTETSYEPERLSQRYLLKSFESAADLFALKTAMEQKLSFDALLSLYESIELPLCRVLADMEKEGFLVDRKALTNFGAMLLAATEAVEKDIFALAGEKFNVSSPKQLGIILFEKLMLPSGKKTKNGWSTGAEVLEKLRGKHEIIDKVLDYRRLTKLKSTYADGLVKNIAGDGRIHTSFQMTATATGRVSSTEPNLQSIPVRTELGAEFRKMFVAAPGKVLVDADYSQIELRLLAHISGDGTMTDAFLSGEDIHAVTASQVFDVPLESVTPGMRTKAKAVNFGIIYGISAFSLSQDIGVSVKEAREYIKAYLEKYSGVAQYMKKIVESARRDGCVITMFGRRRGVPELRSGNFILRAYGERIAMNAPIQGTAADIIKIAMVRTEKRLRDENLGAKLILQIHDELIVECPESEAEMVSRILTEEMQGAASLRVPLIAEAKIGKTWAAAK